MKSSKNRMEQKKKRDEEWAEFLRKKQKHSSRLRTGPPEPGHEDFSPVTISYKEVE